MSTALTVSREQEIVTELSALNSKFQKASRTAVEAGVRMGELLTEVKASVSHGSFIPWVATHCEFSQRAANLYMAAFQAKFAATANLTGEETLVELAALGSKPQAKPAQIAADKAARQAEMEARHAKELAQGAKPKALSAPYQEMVDEAQAATDTLKEFLKQFASAPRLTCKGNEYVLAVLNALAVDLVNNEEARKVFGRAIASMYHPDSGKVRKDHDLMASWNAFVTQLED